MPTLTLFLVIAFFGISSYISYEWGMARSEKYSIVFVEESLCIFAVKIMFKDSD